MTEVNEVVGGTELDILTMMGYLLSINGDASFARKG